MDDTVPRRHIRSDVVDDARSSYVSAEFTSRPSHDRYVATFPYVDSGHDTSELYLGVKNKVAIHA